MKKKNEKIIQDVKTFLNPDNNKKEDRFDNKNKGKSVRNTKKDTESEIIKKEVQEWLKLNAERLSKELITKATNKDWEIWLKSIIL